MNPLARHLLPIYVRTAIYYENGPSTTDARTALVDVIEEVIPESQLEVSDMLAELTNAGATYISLPVEVIGISHQADRTIVTQRSKDTITPGRLSAFIPDDDGTTAEGASYLVLERTSV